MAQPANRRLVTEAALADALAGFSGGDSIKVGGAGPSDGWWFDNGGVESVTAPAPTFSDQDGTANDTYTIPAATGVQYRVSGVARPAGTYPGSGSVTVTAHALAGYVLSGTTSWTFTFSTASAPVPVTPTAPTASDSADTYTIPSTTGVEYLVGGVVQSAGTKSVGDVDTTVTVTARALAGYVLNGTTSWTLTFTQKPVTPLPTQAAFKAKARDLGFDYLILGDDPAGSTTVTNHGLKQTSYFNNTPLPPFKPTGSVTLGGPGLFSDTTGADFAGGTSGTIDNKPSGADADSLAMTSTTIFALVDLDTLSVSANDLHFAGWDRSGPRLMAKRDQPVNGVNTPVLKAMAGNSTFIDTDTPLTKGRHLLAMDYTGTAVHMWIDGEQVFGEATTATIPQGWQSFRIGVHGFAHAPDGRVAAGWKNGALTPTQHLELAQAAGLA